MTDTQWPSFEVFLQDKPGGTHKNVGAVHAPDGEMALMNARDVFVRQPPCYSLWVVPVQEILMVTDQQLEDTQRRLEDRDEDNQTQETYFIFQKTTQRRSISHVEFTMTVEASSADLALRKAVDMADDVTTYVWWVCPLRSIIRSQASDLETMFEQAKAKTYRHPAAYKVISAMQDVKRKSEGGGGS